MRAQRLGWQTALMLFVWGCAGTLPYVSTQPENVRVVSQTSSGSAFSAIKASMHIHRVDANCQTHYLGTIALEDGSPRRAGLAVGELLYLVFAFDASSFVGGRSSVQYETLFAPKKGKSYEVSVSYRDAMYDASIHERTPSGMQGMEIPARKLEDCSVRER